MSAVVDDITKALAFIGGITGPLGLVFTWMAYRRDSVRVRVALSRGYVVRSKADDLVRAMLQEHREQGTDPPMELYVRDPDKHWAYIEVTNVGRRKVYIEKIAWVPED